MKKRFIFITLLVAALACQHKPALREGSDLTVGTPTPARTLKANQSDTFKLDVQEGTLVYGNANQLSVDVVVQVFAPDGRKVAEFDSPARGPEEYHFTSGVEGVHRIVVSPFQQNTGDYTFTIAGAEPLANNPDGRIEQIVKTMLGGETETPGVAIAAVRDGKIVYSKGFGFADLEHNARITPATVFHIASVSKQFTAFAIAMLADQGKVSLDEDIRTYLPELQDFGYKITLDHLVHHTSGLRDQWNLLALGGWRLDDVITQDQIMRLITRQRDLNFKPGDEMLYCNTGFTLMAEVVERVTGESFAEWTRKNMFEPLEMNSTLFYDDYEKIVKNRAYSYYRHQDQGFKKSVLSYGNTGATSLFTTVEDLSKWATNFHTMEVGNERVMEMMERRFVLNNGDTIRYAFGQFMAMYKGLKTISHDGADAGYRTVLLRFPDQKFAVSVFSNLASFRPGQLAYQVADAYLGDELKETPPAQNQNNPPPDDPPFDKAGLKLAEYAGRYTSAELETTYELVLEGDTLVARHIRHDPIRFDAVGTDRFRGGAWFMQSIVFTRDKANKVKGFLVNSGRVRNLVFEREK